MPVSGSSCRLQLPAARPSASLSLHSLTSVNYTPYKFTPMHSANQKVAPWLVFSFVLCWFHTSDFYKVQDSKPPSRSGCWSWSDLISETLRETGMINLGCRENCRRSLTLTKVLFSTSPLVVVPCWLVGELKVLLLVQCSGRSWDWEFGRPRLETQHRAFQVYELQVAPSPRRDAPIPSTIDPLVQLAGAGPHKVARMREKEMTTERVVWPTPNTRACSGAMSFPATRYTPATAAPVRGRRRETDIHSCCLLHFYKSVGCNSGVLQSHHRWSNKRSIVLKTPIPQ